MIKSFCKLLFDILRHQNQQMKPFKILICVGTRPNFIKITKFKKLFENYNHVECKILHTGQHFDASMSTIFFEQLGIGEPDFVFEHKKGSQIAVMAEILRESDELFRHYQPDLVLVPGDVNSSLACAISASRNNILLGHIESGLRSFDRKMPEEINRILIDDLSDFLFVTEPSGLINLRNEQKKEAQIFYVGNTMIDSIVHLQSFLKDYQINPGYNLTHEEFGIATFHRPSNVDNIENLQKIVNILDEISKINKVLFPIHPRTKQNLDRFNIKIDNPNIILLPPLDYINFLGLVGKSKWVITDSGGIQEETSYLGIPCITVRENTERPVTITEGTNTLAKSDVNEIKDLILSINNKTYKKGLIPKYWDGDATARIVKALTEQLSLS